MVWRLAKALEKLREEVNEKWPRRSKASDGTVGDAAHASRASDHNPWIKDGKTGVVSGMDITHDPKGGCDSYALAEFLRASRDPRIKYIISNRRICSPDIGAWAWRKYSGSNPHDHHVHISVKSEKALYDSEAPWGIVESRMPKVKAEQPKPVPPTLNLHDSGEDVIKLQTALNGKGLKLKEDGEFGPVTKNAVKIFQSASGLVADGVAGPQTWKALLEG